MLVLYLAMLPTFLLNFNTVSIIWGAVVKTTITAVNDDNLSLFYSGLLCIAFSSGPGPQQRWIEAELAVIRPLSDSKRKCFQHYLIRYEVS